jgi:hypothetical protein
MLKVLGGYTILEVMIFLIISTALIASAEVAVGGSNAHTQFNQGMRDVNSKIQDWIGNVINGFPGDNQQSYKCSAPGGSRPTIIAGTGSTSPDCIFIGKAVQFTDASSSPTPGQTGHLYAYSVFGARMFKDSSGNTTLSDNMYDSNPIAATGQFSSGTDLTEDYTLPGGLKILSIKSTSSLGPGNSHLIGFFSSFNTEQNTTQNGAESLNAFAFPVDTNQKPANNPGGSTVAQCLELANSSSACKLPVAGDPNQWPPALQNVQICFGSDNNNDTALLTISSNGGLGAQTALDYQVCS